MKQKYMALKKCNFFLRKYLPFLLAGFFLVSCNEPDKTSQCFASDTVKVTDIKEYDGNTYFLVYRISGWHEKTESFEIYNKKPDFDRCGESLIKPVSAELIENKDVNSNDQKVIKVIFKPPSELAFEYAPGENPDTGRNRKFTLEIRR